MSTKRPFATRNDFYKIGIFLAAAAAFVFVGLPLLQVLGAKYIFNPDRLDPYKGLRPDVTMTSTELAGSSSQTVSAFEWHEAYELKVSNTGGLTLGGLRLDTTVFGPAEGKTSADATWVRVKQDGELILPETRLSEMKKLWLHVAATGFKPGERTVLTVEMKIDEELATQEAYERAAPFSFAVTTHLPFQPGDDSYEPIGGGLPDPKSFFPNLGGHDTGM